MIYYLGLAICQLYARDGYGVAGELLRAASTNREEETFAESATLQQNNYGISVERSRRIQNAISADDTFPAECNHFP